MDVWFEVPLTNIVMDALKRLSKNGDAPVTDADLYSYLERAGYSLSPRDIVKSLMVLEALGYIMVEAIKKGETEIMVRVLKSG